MGRNYRVQLNFKVRTIEEVEANDEGEALVKARELAEQASLDNFEFVEEDESKLL